jgi:leucyl aminopeptidase
MEIVVTQDAPGSVEADIFGFGVADPARLPEAATLDPRLARLAADGELTADAGDVCVLHREEEPLRIAAVGLGPVLDADAVRSAVAAVVRAEARVGGTVAWALDPSLAVDLEDQTRAAVDGAVLGGYNPGHWKTTDHRPKPVERLVLLGGDAGAAEVAEREGRIAAWSNRARDLVNRPPNDLTPEKLAERAAEIAGSLEHLTAEALGPDEIRALGMGAFAAVAQGSHNPPRLIVLRYEPPAAKGDVHLGLVGKAITFDTGGISLKPADYMEDMKGDMAGGAAVVEGMGAIADLGVPVRTIAVVASTENMPGGGAYRPGDILTAANGKTIEITNTDAEGRLVLADALWYERGQGATHMVDFATLTGAMERALGDVYAGVFGNDDEWRDLVCAAGEASGDHAWPLPMHRSYRRYIRSHFADLKNSSILRQAIPAYAAEFLQEFAGEGPWAHIDMAGTGFLTRSRGDYLSQAGGTGYGVRLIAELGSRLA